MTRWGFSPSSSSRHPELFATTVSLLNSAISLPPSEKASLNPGEFALHSRPSRSGFFLPLSSGRNNRAARLHRAAISARGGTAATTTASERHEQKGTGTLRTASLLAMGGKGSQAGDGTVNRPAARAGASTLRDKEQEKDGTSNASLSRAEKKRAHYATQLLDPLGVSIAKNRFDRGDDSFGVKAGDLLVSPLGLTVEMAGVGLVHRAAMAPDGMIHVSTPVLVPFVDFKTKCGWSQKRTTRADMVGYRRGHGLAPMENEERMEEFTLSLPTGEGEGEGGGEEDTQGVHRGQAVRGGGGGGADDVGAFSSYRPRYAPAPEHVGIAQRVREMEALREDRVQRRREVETVTQQRQQRAARGKPSPEEEENRLAVGTVTGDAGATGAGMGVYPFFFWERLGVWYPTYHSYSNPIVITFRPGVFHDRSSSSRSLPRRV